MGNKKWNLAQLEQADLQGQLEKARRAGENADATEPRAISAFFDSATNKIIIELKDGITTQFPPDLIQELRGATVEQIEDFFITPGGRSIRWESLDLDFSIPSLIGEIYRLQPVTEVGRKGGQRTSVAKAAAARSNGAKGGRPRKVFETEDADLKHADLADKILRSESSILNGVSQILEPSHRRTFTQED